MMLIEIGIINIAIEAEIEEETHHQMIGGMMMEEEAQAEMLQVDHQIMTIETATIKIIEIMHQEDRFHLSMAITTLPVLTKQIT
jgi:hypothetical protein